MWTSASTACIATSAGVWNSGPTSTSKPEVGERGGDHLLAAVVAVLAHLGHQDARLAAVVVGEAFDHVSGQLGVRRVAESLRYTP
jgi:hypothetical protein